MPPTKRKADELQSSSSSPSPAPSSSSSSSSLVSDLHYAGVYQPLGVISDDAEVDHYVPYGAFHLSLTLTWDDEQRATGNVRGDVYWRYGLYWASVTATQNDESLFWPVARQVETLTGRVQRRVESRGVRSQDSSQQSRGSSLLLTLYTLRLGVIDASASSFADESLVAGEQEHQQVEYALEKFERERCYSLYVDDDAPQLLEGDVTLRFTSTARASGGADQAEVDERGLVEETEEDNVPTHISAWECAGVYGRYEDDEFALISFVHRRIVDEFNVLIGPCSLKAVTTVLGVLHKVIGDPLEGKYRAVNPAKVDKLDEGVSGLLKHCGFKEEFVLEKGAKFLVLNDGADLVLVSLLARVLEDRADTLKQLPPPSTNDVIVIE